MRTVAGSADRIVVVGAGLSGLAAALHLAGRGRQVTVVERALGPGGRAGRRDADGYRMDTGPTVLTMPGIVADTLAAVGESLDARLPLVRLDPAYRAHFADGTTLDVRTDAEAMTDAVRAFAGPSEAAGYRRLRHWLTRLYEAEYARFMAANVDSPFGLLTPELARLVVLGGFGRWDCAVGRFLRDERLRRVFTFQALYAGLAPSRALALYAVIAYMDTVGGVYFPRGGVRALPDALAGAAADAGVTFRYATAVASLERRGRRITAVRTDEDERIRCDAIVLSCDLPEAYRLLGGAPHRAWRLRPAPSAVVLHLAASGAWAGTGHHNLLFGECWETVFDDLVRDGRLMRDPSLLLTRPTATDPSLAPPGRQLMSLLAPVPNLADRPTDWDRLGPAYARELLEVVAGRLGFAPSTVDTLHVLTPADWRRQGLVAGTPFSLAHTFAQTGPFRPANLPRTADNAVLAGCGTVPGVGVPTALLSGRLAADRVTGVVAARRVGIGPARRRASDPASGRR
ncbi:phytoene desaturase family protein [Actinoallomurus purpureus]|uniref:phytoene desaturase family protein n=1 Tax=Actinoallomurus purpureus TaxID=478114 RepID=UPI0020928CDE|nr:phytoene desaturase family protein [Actinoallomurus purpureus]MCO6008646.1 phytoene desaturase family protein [Actinoallomurus purpureus]